MCRTSSTRGTCWCSVSRMPAWSSWPVTERDSSWSTDSSSHPALVVLEEPRVLRAPRRPGSRPPPSAGARRPRARGPCPTSWRRSRRSSAPGRRSARTGGCAPARSGGSPRGCAGSWAAVGGDDGAPLLGRLAVERVLPDRETQAAERLEALRGARGSPRAAPSTPRRRPAATCPRCRRRGRAPRGAGTGAPGVSMSRVEASVWLTDRSVSVSWSFTSVCRASSAFSMPRPTWAATPSRSRSSDSLNSRPVCHQTRNSAPTGSPRTVVGAKRTEWASMPSSTPRSKRGSALASEDQAARPSRQTWAMAGNRARTKGRVRKCWSRCLGT